MRERAQTPDLAGNLWAYLIFAIFDFTRILRAPNWKFSRKRDAHENSILYSFMSWLFSSKRLRQRCVRGCRRKLPRRPRLRGAEPMSGGKRFSGRILHAGLRALGSLPLRHRMHRQKRRRLPFSMRPKRGLPRGLGVLPGEASRE